VDCGIANAVLPAGEVVNHARRVAERFNQLPPGAVQGPRSCCAARSASRSWPPSRTEGALFAQRLRSPEAMEAFQAFFQKRKPDYSKF
jgi:enoyl-CoA hydratase/carnithine racemase